MCFIYSSSFTAVTQSSMARAVCRQMWLVSPQLSFKRQLTACPGGLVGILWAQLNHREKNVATGMQLQEREADPRPAALPESGLWSRDAPIPVRALTVGSNLPLSPSFITSWKPLNQGEASPWQLYPTPATSHSVHGVVVGWAHQPCPKDNNSQQSQQFLLLAFPVCPSLMPTALQRHHWTYLRCDTGDKVPKCGWRIQVLEVKVRWSI